MQGKNILAADRQADIAANGLPFFHLAQRGLDSAAALNVMC